MALKLKSPAFRDKDPIPKEFTCDGENRSPAFAWSDAPVGTKSFVLTCTDPDAPGGAFHHWAIYHIPPGARSLEAGYGAASLDPMIAQALNDFGRPGYGGPCPPLTDGPHRYYFRLAALDITRLTDAPSPSCGQIIALARAHEIETTLLMGTYERGAR